MCSTSLNRRNVIRTVKEGGVTGRTLRDCAGCVAARLGHGTEGTQKAFEILVALEKSFRVVLNDAELRYVSEEERDGFLKRAASSALRVQGTLRRTKQHRAGGIRRLPVSPVAPVDDPWEKDYLDWVSRSCSIHPAGGWNGATAEEAEEAVRRAEIKRLTQEQFVDWAGQVHPVKGCVGLPIGFADQGIDERQLVS